MSKLLASVTVRAIVAFDSTGTMAPIPYGSGDRSLAQSLIAAVEHMNRNNGATAEFIGLDERDADSQWMLKYWDMVDDLIEGEDCVIAKGQKYLPKFRREEQEDYDERMKFAEYTNVFGDIIETLSCKPFEEQVSLVEGEGANTKVIPPVIMEFVQDVDGAGGSLTTFAFDTFYNGIASAIDWIYVDYPKVDPLLIRTQQDMKDYGIRPFWSHVLGRNILEAKVAIIAGAETLVKIRIWEPGSPNHVRVFERYPDGTIVWALFQELPADGGPKKRFIKIDEDKLSIPVIPLVPFITGRRDGRRFKVYPTMKAAAHAQIQLYQQESGLKFAKTMGAYSMLAANGIKPQKGADGKPLPIAVGPNRVLISEPDGDGNVGKWEYITPPAEILKFLKDDIKETMDQLRELGKQPLTAQSGNLTVITTAVAAGKSGSAVAQWAGTLENTLENALLITCMWLNIKTDVYDPDVNVFKDFDDVTGENTDIAALQGMRTSRDLSYINFIKELKRRKVLRADLDPDENIKQLLEETPTNPDDETEGDGGGSNKPSNK